MPFTSEAPRCYLWAKHPQSAQSWAHQDPHQGHLPRHGKAKNKRHKRASVAALFSRLGRTVEPDETADCQAAARYAVKCALGPSQLPFRTSTASINPAPASANSRAGVQPPQAQPLIPAD